MKKVKDHLGREISFAFPPQRIISLCPAITETMYHLNLDQAIVGRTRFCIHPQPEVNNAINVGGTKDMHIDRIHNLQPDLIIAEKEENTKEMVAELEQHYPVFVFEIQTFDDALDMIRDLGNITNRTLEAIQMNKEITGKFQMVPNITNIRVAYVIWKNPYMVVGKNTYIQSLLKQMGFTNPFIKYEGRYPVVTEENLREANLDYIFLATEPFPFRDKHLEQFSQLLPRTKPMIVDGEMFWYGAKMIEAATYFKNQFAKL